MQLAPGQKTPLSAIGISTKLSVEVDYGLDDLDIVVFGLDGNKRLADDRYTVLFSNPASPEGAIRMRPGDKTTSFDIDLAALPASIERLMVVASHDHQPLVNAKPLVVTVARASFDAGTSLGQERALMLVEIYRHNGEWRLSANGQGFAKGLAKLIEHLGGDVAGDSPATPARQHMQQPSPTPVPIPTPAAAPARAPISLNKITLEKTKSISLEKTGSAFGDTILNLNWRQKPTGMFGGKALDLDLGVVYEMMDGTRGVVQSLGKVFGRFHEAPYMELDGDDRTGSNTGGETIRINGKHFDSIRKIAVFALIYEGAVRWEETDARASIKSPGQPEIVVEIRDGNDRQRVYGMAIIENIGGKMAITNHARGYKDQKEFADDVGIILNWTHGRK